MTLECIASDLLTGPPSTSPSPFGRRAVTSGAAAAERRSIDLAYSFRTARGQSGRWSGRPLPCGPAALRASGIGVQVLVREAVVLVARGSVRTGKRLLELADGVHWCRVDAIQRRQV